MNVIVSSGPLAPPSQGAGQGLPNCAPSVGNPTSLSRDDLHRRIRLAHRDMDLAESDQAYASAKADLDDASRLLAGLGVKA